MTPNRNIFDLVSAACDIAGDLLMTVVEELRLAAVRAENAAGRRADILAERTVR